MATSATSAHAPARLELALSGKSTQLDWSATPIDASFRSSEVPGGAANSSANADGNITIRSGDRLPLIARHNFKASAERRRQRRMDAGKRACVPLERQRARQ
jgi:hypothetical protein